MCGQIPVVFHFLHAVLIAHYDQQNALALDEHASQIIVFEKCPLDQSLQVTSYKLQVFYCQMHRMTQGQTGH